MASQPLGPRHNRPGCRCCGSCLFPLSCGGRMASRTKAYFSLSADIHRPSHSGRKVSNRSHPDWIDQRDRPCFRHRITCRSTSDVCLFRYKSLWFSHLRSQLVGNDWSLHADRVRDVRRQHSLHQLLSQSPIALNEPLHRKNASVSRHQPGIKCPEVHRAWGPARNRIAFAQSSGSIGL